ncbi:hypothetical protein JB92DRAFT_119819 [Gautieria morchelliformis]|nr:hypothetical protein JB92DRAFT_119819 [Gautieria morchelliformis]
MTHPPQSELGSAAQDFCAFFASSTHWDVPWYSAENPTPPPLEQITDCTRTHSIQWRGDARTLSGGVLFGDLSACWYTVEWSGGASDNTTKARRSAAFIPKPDSLSQDELIAAHQTYGETVAGFAEGYEGTGQWCARGECWDLANEALGAFKQWDYVPRPLPCIGRTHGHLIFEGKAWGKDAVTQQAGSWRGGDDRIRRGDIIQWKSATITEGRATTKLGDPDHTAIIVRDQQPLRTPVNSQAMRPADVGQLEVVEQSVHSPPSRTVYQLGGMEAGELWIYRPIGMEMYLKFTFSANWPDGLQPNASG